MGLAPLLTGGNTAVVADDGTWSVAVVTGELTANAANVLSATQTDVAGNVSAAGTTTITTDLVVAAPLFNTISTDDLINAAEETAGFNLTGTGEVGATVTVTGFTVADKTAVVDASGNWTMAVATGELTADAANALSATQTDVAGNVSAAGTTTITTDLVAPTLSSSTPADEAVAVGVGDNIVLTFNETIALGTGTIVLKKTSDDSVIETFDVAAGTGDAGGTVTAIGTAVTINPNASLTAGIEYYVTVAATAVEDTAGNPYAGISLATDLNFTAVDAPIALVTLTTSDDIRTGGTGNDTLTGHFDQATPANITLNAGDTITGGLGTDTLTLTTLSSTGSVLTLDDAFFTGVTGFEVLVIGTTVSDNQVITADVNFETAFATDGIDLTTETAAGNITIDMTSFTGDAIFRTTSVAGTQNISGASLADVTSVSTTGTQTIVTGTGIAATVDATSSTGAVSVTTSSLADSVNLTTDDVTGSGNVINTGAGDDTITLDAGTAVTTLQNIITGGTGADAINLNVNASKDVIVIGVGDSTVGVDTFDTITNFTIANDILNLATTTIMADTAGVDGTDSGALLSHAIVAGLITFDDANTFAGAVIVNAANLADAIDYCVANVTGAGESVMFQYDASGDGNYGVGDAVFVFQDDGATDTLVALVGLDTSTHTILGVGAAANTVVIA